MVITYEVIAAPPSVWGSTQSMVPVPPCMPASTSVGASGAFGEVKYPRTVTITSTVPLLWLVMVSSPLGDTDETRGAVRSLSWLSPPSKFRSLLFGSALPAAYTERNPFALGELAATLSTTVGTPADGTPSIPVAVNVMDPPAGTGVAATPPVQFLVSAICCGGTEVKAPPALLAVGLTRYPWTAIIRSTGAEPWLVKVS